MKKTAHSNIPIIELTPIEQIWLNELYKHFKENKRLQYRQIRAALNDKLSDNFKKTDIDSRLVNYGIYWISLLGIIALDRNYKVLNEVDKIIYAIKNLLIKNPLKERFHVKEIAEKINLPENKIGLLFEAASYYGRFYSSAGKNNNDGAAYSEFNIGNDDEHYDQYMNFKGIEPLIEKYLREEDTVLAQKRKTSSSPSTEVLNGHTDRAVCSVFKSTNVAVQKKIGFILMPFIEDWSDRVYKKVIRGNIEAMGLQCLRADNKHGSIVIEDVWVGINQAAFIVADVTTRNPNVMYELGIAHTLAKPTILITQSLDYIPFDFKHLRHYLYKDTLDGVEEFQEKFRSAIQEIYQQYYPDIPL